MEDASFSEEVLRKVLVEVSKAMTETDRVIIAGGSAIALRYNSSHLTTDIDVIDSDDIVAGDAFWKAVESVSKNHPDFPKINKRASAVANVPWNWEDRLEKIPGFDQTNLIVYVPEIHDLALMKLSRGEERDFEGIEAVHWVQPFDTERLLRVFEDEMAKYIVADVSRIRSQIKGAIRHLKEISKKQEEAMRKIQSER